MDKFQRKVNNIWVTGDIHGDPTRFSCSSFYEQKSLPEENKDRNFVIVCGDFGLIWDYHGENNMEKYYLNWLEQKPFTVLFVDGNHENFDRLYSYPVEEWHGGKVHKIRDNIIHLMRGECYTIAGKKFFTFGGASSHDISDGILDKEKDAAKIKAWEKSYDKLFRVNKVSWWEQELPSEEEMENGIRNLEKINWKVDGVITHCTAESLVPSIYKDLVGYKSDILTEYLEKIRNKLQYDFWICGHLHLNAKFTDKDICLYEQIVKIL